MATLFNRFTFIGLLVIAQCILVSCGDDYEMPELITDENEERDKVCFTVVNNKNSNPIDSAILDYVVIKKVKVISDWSGELVDGSLTEYLKGYTNMSGERCFSYDNTYVPYRLTVFKKGYDDYIYINWLWDHSDDFENTHIPIPPTIRLEPHP